MAETFLEKAEEQELFRQKQNKDSGLLFHTVGSSGRNPQKLAQLLAGWDFVMRIMKWQEKPLANLTMFVAQYQGSIDAKYHDDFKEVQIAEEIERKRSERKGISILQQ